MPKNRRRYRPHNNNKINRIRLGSQINTNKIDCGSLDRTIENGLRNEQRQPGRSTINISATILAGLTLFFAIFGSVTACYFHNTDGPQVQVENIIIAAHSLSIERSGVPPQVGDQIQAIKLTNHGRSTDSLVPDPGPDAGVDWAVYNPGDGSYVIGSDIVINGGEARYLIMSSKDNTVNGSPKFRTLSGKIIETESPRRPTSGEEKIFHSIIAKCLDGVLACGH